MIRKLSILGLAATVFCAAPASADNVNQGTNSVVTPGVNVTTISGGNNNKMTDFGGTISGGASNQAGNNSGNIGINEYATVGGGFGNKAAGSYATVSGGSTNEAAGSYATISGGYSNKANPNWATVGGGQFNTATNSLTTVGGGQSNNAAGQVSTVSGGHNNVATGSHAAVGGGYINVASGVSATVGGGSTNSATANNATVPGGNDNIAAGNSATVGGGFANGATADFATVPGGRDNTASGTHSFAAGRCAKADDEDSFVWNSNSTCISSTARGQFTAKAYGGVRFFSNSTATVGVEILPGAGSWTMISDRNLKANFRTVDGEEVLAKLVAIPVSTWNYTTQNPIFRHIGPMAQDFAAAFGVGEDERRISTVDAHGVALAAIQGLHKLVLRKDAQIARLEEQTARLQNELQQQREQTGALKQAQVNLSSAMETRLAAMERLAQEATNYRQANHSLTSAR